MSGADTNTAIALALQPWPTEDHHSDSIEKLIRRIAAERGHIRNVTEEDLEEEIREAEAGNDVMIEEEGEEETPDENKLLEALYKTKFEMRDILGRAANEALLALDFVSLLVSRYNPKAADLTMSPLLKSTTPAGTLDIDKWPVKEVSEAEKRKELQVAQGWRVQSLSSAADSLLDAATRLEKEVRKETQYWDEVLSITEKGWSVRRIPWEKHTLGVQFGFAEANENFKGRGFVPLRTDEDGSILLDPELTQKPKGVRLRIAQDGKTVGTSDVPFISFSKQVPIEDLIRRARDSLFEEELYHEMTLEARILISYQVRLRDSVIHVPAPTEQYADREILIDMVPLDELQSPADDNSLNSLANNIALALRMLLSHAHRQKLLRRSQLPPPLSSRKPPKLIQAIIRPLLSYFQHDGAIHCLRRYFSSAKAILHTAGLDVKFSLKLQSTLSTISKAITETRDKADTGSLLDEVMDTLINPPTTTASLTLPSSPAGAALNITIRTLISAPTFGTEYVLTVPTSLASLMFSTDSLSAARTKSFIYNSFSELKSYLDLLLSLDLSHLVIAAKHEDWEPGDRTPTLTHSAIIPGQKSRKQIEVRFNGQRLLLKCETKGGAGKIDQYEWDAEQGKKGFREVVGRFAEAD